ncbi:mat2b [Symbiodinium sp. CCMP2592]|nr:mat2b [Symbiodinium sp. CCMP2592]
MPARLGTWSRASLSSESTPDGITPSLAQRPMASVVFPVPTLLSSPAAAPSVCLPSPRRARARIARTVEDSDSFQERATALKARQVRSPSSYAAPDGTARSRWSMTSPARVEAGSQQEVQDWCALKRRLFLLIAEVERQMVQQQGPKGFSRGLTPSLSPGALRSAMEVREEDVEGLLADVSFARPGALALRPQRAANSLCSDSSRCSCSGSQPRVLVLGSSYMGTEVLQELSKGWEVQAQGLCSSPPVDGPLWSLLNMELSSGELQSHLQGFQPHALVNCHTSAALLELESESESSPEKEKDARSREVLAFLTSLATACEASQIFLLHVSSDAVFGTRQQTQHSQPQSVDAEPQPCTPLGWRTLAAEQEVLSRRASAVLRLPLLWDGPAGPAQSLEESASRVLSELRRGVREFEDRHCCYPTPAVEVASIVANLLQLTWGPREQRPRGIYHWQGGDQLTQFEMAQLVADVSGMKVFLQPVRHPSKLRKSCLDCSRTVRTVRVPRRVEIIGSLRACLPAAPGGTQQEQHV